MSETRKELYPLLPKMKRTYNVGHFTEGGAWKPCDSGELQNLSEGLNLEKVDPRFFEVTSVPDMWARPLLFTMALYHDSHPVHNLIVGEWRGLLAMLALREYRKRIKISVEEIHLADPKTSTGIDDRDFLATLGRLAPTKSMATDTDWKQIHVILCGEQPIGLTSPTTLVCTAPHYYNRISGALWMDGSIRLIDPVPKLNRQEKDALASWLYKLRENLSAHDKLNEKFVEFDTLLRLLDNFLQDLGGRPVVSMPLSQNTLGLNNGVFRYLDRSVEGRKSESHVALKPLGGIQALTLLVAFPEIAEQWDLPPQDVIVIDCATLAEYPKMEGLDPQRRVYAGQTLPDEMLLRNQEDFFTSRLVLIQKKPALPGALLPESARDMLLDGQPHSPILPLRPEIMKYIGSDDLCRRLRFENTKDSILCHLNLRLSGPGGGGRDVQLTKEFKRSANQIQIISNVPVLEVWPNFRTPAWKVYFSYVNMAQVKSFRAEPLARACKSRVLKYREDKAVATIHRTEAFPEVFVCKIDVAEGGSLNSVDAGLLLVSKPPLLDHAEGNIDFGIDFGTTNTHVYKRVSEASPAPVTFESRPLAITASGSDRQYIFRDFIPSEAFPTPFLSFYHDHKRADQLHGGVLVDGHIYFQDTIFQAMEGLETDLKWSAEPRIRQFTELFLEQVCLHCCAEAAASNRKTVKWHFSYPTAFSGWDLESFGKIWQNITAECQRSTGIDAGKPPRKMAESVASARFFAEHPEILIKAPFNDGTVCIDIGGGTSDISVWQENKLVWQISLRFAGRNILFDHLFKDPAALLLLVSSKEASGKGSLFDFAAQDQRMRFNAALDTWLRFQSKADGTDQVLTKLPKLTDEPQMKDLIRFIAVGLSGLIFYIGQVLHHLTQSSQYKGVLPRVCVGGNGAKLFHWLASGRFDKSAQAHRLFQALLEEASGLKDEGKLFEISISPQPKCEAAFGLVVAGKNLEVPDSVDERVIAGEDHYQSQDGRGWDSLVSAGVFHAGLKVADTLPQMRRFIQVFNAHAPRLMKMQPLPEGEIPRVRTHLSQYFSELTAQPIDKIHVEPLFIAEIKFLLELLSARIRENRQ